MYTINEVWYLQAACAVIGIALGFALAALWSTYAASRRGELKRKSIED